MSIFTWGAQPKSQVDPETVEEAITRIVAQHEHDPASHLGENESIEAHRTSEVIDHLAGSILPDKKDMTDLNYDINFQSLDGFSITGYASVGDLKLNLYVESPSANTARVYFVPFQEDLYSTASYSMLLQCITWFSGGTLSTAYLEFHRVGFQLEHGRIRGYYWTNGFASQEFTPWYTIDMNVLHSLRAQYFSLEGVARFYADGDIVGELTFPFTPQAEDVILDLNHSRNTQTDVYLYIASLKLALFERQ